MLAKPAAMPRRPSSYAYEPKWDGFRAMLRTEHGLRVLSQVAPAGKPLSRTPVRGWGAAASTFFDDVSRFLGTENAPMLMVAIGARA
jgi:hypothetical protein